MFKTRENSCYSNSRNCPKLSIITPYVNEMDCDEMPTTSLITPCGSDRVCLKRNLVSISPFDMKRRQRPVLSSTSTVEKTESNRKFQSAVDESKACLKGLPVDALGHVLKFLSILDYARLLQLSKKWYVILFDSTNTHLCWKLLPLYTNYKNYFRRLLQQRVAEFERINPLFPPYSEPSFSRITSGRERVVQCTKTVSLETFIPWAYDISKRIGENVDTLEANLYATELFTDRSQPLYPNVKTLCAHFEEVTCAKFRHDEYRRSLDTCFPSLSKLLVYVTDLSKVLNGFTRVSVNTSPNKIQLYIRSSNGQKDASLGSGWYNFQAGSTCTRRLLHGLTTRLSQRLSKVVLHTLLVIRPYRGAILPAGTFNIERVLEQMPAFSVPVYCVHPDIVFEYWEEVTTTYNRKTQIFHKIQTLPRRLGIFHENASDYAAEFVYADTHFSG